MTTLDQFGVDVPDDEPERSDPEEEPDTGTRRFRNGRCPAIAVSHRKRCKAPVSRMNNANGFCATHGRERNPYSIDSDPGALILITGEIGHATTLGGVEQDAVDFDAERIRDSFEAVDLPEPDKRLRGLA